MSTVERQNPNFLGFQFQTLFSVRNPNDIVWISVTPLSLVVLAIRGSHRFLYIKRSSLCVPISDIQNRASSDFGHRPITERFQTKPFCSVRTCLDFSTLLHWILSISAHAVFKWELHIYGFLLPFGISAFNLVLITSTKVTEFNHISGMSRSKVTANAQFLYSYLRIRNQWIWKIALT